MFISIEPTNSFKQNNPSTKKLTAFDVMCVTFSYSFFKIDPDRQGAELVNVMVILCLQDG